MVQMQHSCEDELKEASLKVTPARVAAMKLFESHDKPLDVAHIIDDLAKKLDIDKVTVYRILNAFTEKGLLKKIEFGEGKARYELNKEEHHHLICQTCGAIKDISDCGVDKLVKEINQKKKFLIKSHSLEFYGECVSCQKKTN